MGADPDVLGCTVPMDGESVPIVGVARAHFPTPYDEAWFWQPMQGDQLLSSVGLPTGTPNLNFHSIIARLKTGVDAATAEDNLRALARRIDRSVGKTEAQWSSVATVRSLAARARAKRGLHLRILVCILREGLLRPQGGRRRTDRRAESEQ